MAKFLKQSLIGAALLAAGVLPGAAADIYEPPVYEEPPVEIEYGGWYIRGHIGMSNQRLKVLESSLFSNPAILSYGWHDKGGFDSAPLFGGGVGYKLNDYLRGDITLEYRGKSDFNALVFVTTAGGTTTNDYRAKKSEWLVLANAYADLGKYHGITPYVGVGIGASRNTISHFRDVNILNGGAGYAGTASKWNLAWALHAGVAFEATERLTVDLGYSFVNLGDAKTGTFFNDDPLFDIPNNGFQFKNLSSHDVKLGVRYSLQ
ncbi:MAG: porin family protein [Mesorhizobium sp.]|nr:porin family protein [Mesorhizobium sp.]